MTRARPHRPGDGPAGQHGASAPQGATTWSGRKSEPPARGAATTTAVPEDFAAFRVVVLHQDPDDLEVLESVAHAYGFSLSGVSSKAGLLSGDALSHADVVVLHSIAPRDAAAVCEALRARIDTAGVPVALIAPEASASRRIEALLAGCDEFLSTPVDRHALAQRLRTLARLRRARQERDEAYAVLATAVRMVEARLGTAPQHGDQLHRIAGAFGAFLGLSREDVEALRLAAAFHDVGMLSVPEAVVGKPGPLTPEERALVEGHPVRGAALLARLPSMQDVLPVVRHHHERWDGRGYPDGLAGEQIPLLARVFRVVDVFDALIRDRPHRNRIAPSLALEITCDEGRLGRADPHVVSEFLRFVELHGLPAAEEAG